MTSTVAAILQQSSPGIYKLALQRIFRFATTSVLEPKLAGRYTGDLVRSAVKVDPPQVIPSASLIFEARLDSRCEPN